MATLRTKRIRRGGLLSAAALLAIGLGTSAGAAQIDLMPADTPDDVQPAQEAPQVPSISGSGHVYFDDDDDRYFTFDASGLAVEGYPDEGVPGTTGSFLVAHYTDESHRSGVKFWGHVDCLLVGGRTATFTGVVDRAISFGEGVPDVSGLEGVRRGFSVYDSDSGRRDRLGFSWFMDPGDITSSQKCQGPAPFAYVDKGDYETTEWLPPTLIPPRG